MAVVVSRDDDDDDDDLGAAKVHRNVVVAASSTLAARVLEQLALVAHVSLWRGSLVAASLFAGYCVEQWRRRHPNDGQRRMGHSN